jgi:hypothetical protein
MLISSFEDLLISICFPRRYFCVTDRAVFRGFAVSWRESSNGTGRSGTVMLPGTGGFPGQGDGGNPGTAARVFQTKRIMERNR